LCLLFDDYDYFISDEDKAELNSYHNVEIWIQILTNYFTIIAEEELDQNQQLDADGGFLFHNMAVYSEPNNNAFGSSGNTVVYTVSDIINY
jgi:hypothetical protein